MLQDEMDAGLLFFEAEKPKWLMQEPPESITRTLALQIFELGIFLIDVLLILQK